MTPEFILVAVACGVGTACGVYLSARRNLQHVDYGFIVTEVVREYEPDEGTMDGSQLTFEDAEQAIAARNKILDGVADNNASWLRQAAEEMARLDCGLQDTGEGFRKRLLERGVKPPAHVNAWGSLFMTLTKRKVLVPTGEYRPMLDARSHARKTPVYTLQRPEAA